jgi:hypothetical protein
MDSVDFNVVKRFSYKGKKIEYAYHQHPVLGYYTALSIGKVGYMIEYGVTEKDIKKFIDSGKYKMGKK